MATLAPLRPTPAPSGAASNLRAGLERGAFASLRLHAPSGDAPQAVFLAPVLPHPCELDLWNAAVQLSSMRGVLVTGETEAVNLQRWIDSCQGSGIPVVLQCKTLPQSPENPTFVSSLETVLGGAAVVVCAGEESLASYQALILCRPRAIPLVLWQTSPRPQLVPRTPEEAHVLARVQSVRREVLKGADLILAADKEGAQWAELEGAPVKKIRKLGRAIAAEKFKGVRASRRKTWRKRLGISPDDWVVLHLGSPREDAHGADTLLAFRGLLARNPDLRDRGRLVFFGTGHGEAALRRLTLEFGLDANVFFIQPAECPGAGAPPSSVVHILALADLIVHNPAPGASWDYDVLSGAALGIPFVTSGAGTAGKWLAQFYTAVPAGCILSLTKAMASALSEAGRLVQGTESALQVVLHDFPLSPAAGRLAAILQSTREAAPCRGAGLETLLAEVDRSAQGSDTVATSHLIERAFEHYGTLLSCAQQAGLLARTGDLFARLGDLEEAEALYQAALQLSPECPRAHLGLGTLALATSKAHLAIPRFQRAIAADPCNENAFLGLGLALEAQGDLPGALQWAVRACDIAPLGTHGVFHLVRLSYAADTFGEALRCVQQTLRGRPGDRHLTFVLAGLHFKTGNLGEASRAVDAVLAADPQHEGAAGLAAQLADFPRRAQA